MMLLQYWPLGIWGVTVGTYIAENTGQQGEKIFSAGFVGYSTAAGAIGSLISPVLVGFLSDRYFAAQRLLALLHVSCTVAAWFMFESRSQIAFFLWLVVYFQCFAPAASLTNKIALRHLRDADAEYPTVRIFSTIGWIGAGLFLGFVWPWFAGTSIEATRTPLALSALGSLLMALYSLTLPPTPPELRSRGVFAASWRDISDLFRNRPLVVFLFVSILACIPTMAYNNYGNLFLNRQGFPRPAALMTLGQLSDVLVLWATPWLVARFGLRLLFISGVCAWIARYTLLAAGSYFDIAWPVYAAILIHGACYVFVYVVGVMYIDHLADGKHRGVTQGMYSLASSGLGHLLGAFTVGVAQSAFLTPERVSPPPYHWTEFWVVPALCGLATVILFGIFFRRPNPAREIRERRV